jgi:virulence-associated protein VagC
MKSVVTFRNGRSQAVRIAKEFEFECKQVDVVRLGNGIYLTPHEEEPWGNALRVGEQPSRYPEKLPPAPDQQRDLSW